MATYLLLRNNKESGPYSLEGLIQLGLKPYDLVWVQGRSAAWRYPSEVDDLKFYAPVVEEQPYDRFYKKPSEEQKEKEKQEAAFQQVKQQVIRETAQINIPEVKQTNIPEVKNDTENIEVNIPKKQVFVSMPVNSGKTVFIKKSEEVKVAASAGAVNDLYNKNQDSFIKTEPVLASASPSYSELVNDYNNQYSAEKKTTVIKEAAPSKEDTYPVETKYSQSLDDIKDMYVQTLADRKRKNAQRKMVMVMVKKVIPFAAVLIAGMLMGIFIMNRKNGNENLSQLPQTIIPKNEPVNTKTDLNQAQQQVASQTEQLPAQTAENKVPGNIETDLTKTGVQKDISTDKQNSLNNTATNAKKNLVKENKTTTPGNSGTVLAQPKSIEPDPTTGERNKIVRSETDNTTATPAKQLPVTAWKQVSVKSNEYKRGTFGGIHDLQVTVTNNSNFLLDNVLVELQYLKPSDQPLKTDNIRFSPVPPNGSLTLAIPPTSRGVKVSCKIIHVESKAAGNDTAGL